MLALVNNAMHMGKKIASAFCLTTSCVRFERRRTVLVPLKYTLQCDLSVWDLEVARKHPRISSSQKILRFTMFVTESLLIGGIMVPESIGRKSNILEVDSGGCAATDGISESANKPTQAHS